MRKIAKNSLQTGGGKLFSFVVNLLIFKDLAVAFVVGVAIIKGTKGIQWKKT